MTKNGNYTFEDYFEWYLQDLQKNGFISLYKKGKEITPFEISEESKHTVIDKIYRTGKITYKEKSLIKKHTYKPDFLLYWTPKAKNVFYELVTDTIVYDSFFLANEKDGYFFSFVDVKPPPAAAAFSGRQNSYATFPINQGIVYKKFGIYVNKVVPIPASGSGEAVALFKHTFVPNRFLFTDGGTGPRKINFKANHLSAFLEKRYGHIDFVNINLKSRLL